MFSSTSKTGSWAWALVFLGLVVLVADIVSIQMLGTKPSPFVVTPAAAPVPNLAPVAPPLPPAEPVVERVEVPVAARDLPVGTVLTRDDLKSAVKVRKVPKEGLPASYVSDAEQLAEKRLTRAVRTDETFNPQDLQKATEGGPVLPAGYDMVSLAVSPAASAAGFVGPGSRVNVLATLRVGNKLHAFPLLVNVLVVAVDTTTTGTTRENGTYPAFNTVSFAVKEKDALVLALAKQRGCSIELMLRHPDKTAESDKNYDIDAVVKLLSDVPEVVAEVAPPPRPVGDR